MPAHDTMRYNGNEHREILDIIIPEGENWGSPPRPRGRSPRGRGGLPKFSPEGWLFTRSSRWAWRYNILSLNPDHVRGQPHQVILLQILSFTRSTSILIFQEWYALLHLSPCWSCCGPVDRVLGCQFLVLGSNLTEVSFNFSKIIQGGVYGAIIIPGGYYRNNYSG